jgi:Flp pilus assembly pilin Flp
MTDAKSAWHDTSERFSSLGTKLKLHYEQQRGADAEESKAEVRDALKRLSGALEDAFEAIGTAARDDAVKTDVKQVGQSLVTALGATFSEVSAEVQRAFASRGGAGGASTAGEPSSTVPATPESSTAEPAAGGSADAPATGGTEPGEGDPPKVEPWGTP